MLYKLGFIIVTVSSLVVVIVVSSSNPDSGMTIAALLFISIILVSIGQTGESGMVTAIVIGDVVCIAAAVAGDTCYVLKTGYIVGSTPKWQQYATIFVEFIPIIVIGRELVL